MPFDPTQPFTVVSKAGGASTGFDPSKPFTRVARPGLSSSEFDRLLPRSPVPLASGLHPAGEDTTAGGPQMLTPSRETGRALGAELEEEATTPLKALPKFTINKDDSKTVAVGKEAANLLVGIPEFLETPLGIATAPVGGLAPRTVAALFGVSTVHQLGKTVLDTHRNWDKYTPAQRAAAVTDIAGDTVLAGLLARTATKTKGTQNATGKFENESSVQPQRQTGNEGGQAAGAGDGNSIQPEAQGPSQTPQENAAAQAGVGGRSGENTAALPPRVNPPQPATRSPELEADLKTLGEVMEDERRSAAVRATGEKRAAGNNTDIDSDGRGSAKRPHITGRPDGVPDILDAIQEEGGIRPPGAHAGPEYDGYSEAMQGPARLLRNQSSPHYVDGMMQALEARGFHFETPDHFWDAVKRAARERQALPERMKRESQAADYEAKAFEEWDKTLSYRDNAIWSGNKKLADVRALRSPSGTKNVLIPTLEAQQMPAHYQEHLIGKFSGVEVVDPEAGKENTEQPTSNTERLNADIAAHGRNIREDEEKIATLRTTLKQLKNPTVKADTQKLIALHERSIAKEKQWMAEKQAKIPRVTTAEGGKNAAPGPKGDVKENTKSDISDKSDGSSEIKYGVPKAQWDEMANFNDYDQQKKWGTTRAKLIEKEMLAKYGRGNLSSVEANDEARLKAAAKHEKAVAGAKPSGSAAPAPKLNPTEQKLLDSAYDNKFGKGWIPKLNERPTTKAAFKSLREKGLIEYKVTDGWAGNQLTEAGRKISGKGQGPTEAMGAAAPRQPVKSPERVAAEKSATAMRERVQSGPDIQAAGTDLAKALDEEFRGSATGQKTEAMATGASGQSGRRSSAALPQIGGPGAIAKQPWFAGLRAALNPMSLGDAARDVAAILRYAMGKRFESEQRFDANMEKYRSVFDRATTPRGYKYDPAQALPANWEIQRAIDTGDTQGLTPTERAFANLMHKMFQEATQQIQKFKPDVLQDLYEHYFPRSWVKADGTDVDENFLGMIRSHRPWEGPKTFLKPRTIALWDDALLRGLKPKFDNPVDAVYAKLSEMWRFAGALEAHTLMKARGVRRFRYIFERAPEGWVPAAPDDPSTKVFAPPTVTIKEAFDQQLRTKTVEMLRSLGISHQRLESLGGKRWGEATGTDRIRTRFAGPDFVFWHEVGHILDHRFADLRKALGLDKQIVMKNGVTIWRGSGIEDKELRKLADLRLPATSGKGFQSYVRRTPEKIANVFHAYVHAPDLFKQVAPNVFSKLKRWLAKHPDVQGPLDDIRPSLQLGSGTTQKMLGGPVLLGEWIMPADAAQVLRNHLASGLWGKVKSLSTLKRIGGVMANVRLISLFHGQMVSNDALASGLSLPLYDAMKAVAEKRPELLKRAAADFFLAPMRPFMALRQGGRMLESVRSGQSGWKGHGPKTLDAEMGHWAVEANLRTGHLDHVDNATRRWKKALYEAGNSLKSGHPTGAAAPLWSAFLNTPLMISHEMMRPVMEWFVPRMKYGLFAPMAMRVIRDNPGADEMTLRKLMGKAADSVEDRVGQVTYDNMFLSRAVKDSGQLALQAFGWHATKERMLWGAGSDYFKAGKALLQGRTPEITFRMTYLPAMVVTHALIGGTIMYALTGRRPKSTMDYLFPETGLVDQYGRPVRVAIADFMKDYLTEFDAMAHGPKATVQLWERRLMPVWNTLADMYRNRDFWNTRIFSERKFNEPEWQHLWDNLKEGMAYVVQGNQPFSAKGAEYFKQDLSSQSTSAQKALAYAGPYFGFVPAPQAVTQSPAEARASEIMRDSAAPKSKDQEQQALLLAALVHDLRTGKIGDAGELRAREHAAGIDPNTKDGKLRLTELKKRVLWTPLQYQISKLALYQPGGADAMTVWDLMSDKEKQQTAPIYKDKILSAFKGGGIDKDTAVRLMRAVGPFLAVKNDTATNKPAGTLSKY